MISEELTLMPEVYLGAGGDVVICQEFPDLNGETYFRIFVSPNRAEEFSKAIMAAAARAKA